MRIVDREPAGNATLVVLRADAVRFMPPMRVTMIQFLFVNLLEMFSLSFVAQGP